MDVHVGGSDRPNPNILQTISGRSGIEAETECVERAEQEVAPACGVVGAVERPSRRLDSDAGQGLRWKRKWSRADHLQFGALGRLTVEEVEADVCGEPRRADSESG